MPDLFKIKPSKKAAMFEKFVPTMEWRFKRGIRNGAFKAGSSVVRGVKQSLNTGTRTGIKYPKLPNRSSAGGEVPRSQSGRLANSAYYKVRGYTEIRVGENIIYAKYLENGTENEDGTVRMLPRPHLNRTISEEERNTENYLYREVLKEIAFT